jgi:oxygen-independent coproporphyrinogen-3 oxidase
MACQGNADLLRRLTDHPMFASRQSSYVRWYPKSLEPPPKLSALAAEVWRPRGVYIHVPFCDRLCRFCPFNKRQTQPELVKEFVASLNLEVSIYSEIISKSDLRYVYFGGGTPSVLPPSTVASILEALHKRIGLAAGAEVTLESHPTHINEQFLREMQSAGVNRFSTGLQSFDEHALSDMGAQHTTEDVRRAIKACSRVGVALAADLLFRCRGQTLAGWEREIREAISSGIEHLSCYSLVLKPGADQPSIYDEAEMTVLMHSILSDSGYKHYASCASGGFDYAMPGRECAYELGHWGAPQDEFLGLGPGGIGFVGGRTTMNGLDLGRYADAVRERRLPLASATLATQDELRRRYFVLGVKSLWVDLAKYRDHFQENPSSRFEQEFRMLETAQLATVGNDRMDLTQLGRFFVDTISSAFFSAEQADVPHPEEPEIRRMEVALSRL